MKITKLSSELLNAMCKRYSSEQKDLFDFEDFQVLFPDIAKNLIADSLILLESDGFVSNFYADGIPYTTTLFPTAIRSVEENTLLNRGYTLANSQPLLTSLLHESYSCLIQKNLCESHTKMLCQSIHFAYSNI